jgi:cell division protein FtsQ
MEKRLKKTLIIFVVVCILVGCDIFFFRVTEVTVEGNTFFSQAEMEKKLCTSKLDYNTSTFFLRNLLGHRVSLPFVRQYEVTFPGVHKVHIKLYEKTIVSGVKYMNEYVYFDKDGMVLESSNTPKNNVPVFEVSGMKKFSLYQVVQMQDQDMLKEMLDIANLITHYNIKAERIVFDSTNQVNIYSGNVRVILGKGQNHDDAMSALRSVLPKAAEQNLQGQIDMSNYSAGDNIILKKK